MLGNWSLVVFVWTLLGSVCTPQPQANIPQYGAGLLLSLVRGFFVTNSPVQ